MFVLTPREQGNLGEYSAVEWFMSKGMGVAVPIGHSPDWDLMAEIDGRAAKVQVKTTGRLNNGRWGVAICTRGGNRSWSGLVKYLDPSRCDFSSSSSVTAADGSSRRPHSSAARS